MSASFNSIVSATKATLASNLNGGWVSNHQQVTGIGDAELLRKLTELTELKDANYIDQKFWWNHTSVPQTLPYTPPNIVTPNTVPWTPNCNQITIGPYQTGTGTIKLQPQRGQLPTKHTGPSEEYGQAIAKMLEAGFQEATIDIVPGAGRATQRDFVWGTDDGNHEVFVTYLDLRPTGLNEEYLNFSLSSGSDDNDMIGAVALNNVPPQTVSGNLALLVSGMILAREALTIGISPSIGT